MRASFSKSDLRLILYFLFAIANIHLAIQAAAYEKSSISLKEMLVSARSEKSQENLFGYLEKLVAFGKESPGNYVVAYEKILPRLFALYPGPNEFVLQYLQDHGCLCVGPILRYWLKSVKSFYPSQAMMKIIRFHWKKDVYPLVGSLGEAEKQKMYPRILDWKLYRKLLRLSQSRPKGYDVSPIEHLFVLTQDYFGSSIMYDERFREEYMMKASVYRQMILVPNISRIAANILRNDCEKFQELLFQVIPRWYLAIYQESNQASAINYDFWSKIISEISASFKLNNGTDLFKQVVYKKIHCSRHRSTRKIGKYWKNSKITVPFVILASDMGIRSTLLSYLIRLCISEIPSELKAILLNNSINID